MCSIWRGRSVSLTTTAMAPAVRVPKNAAAASHPRSSKRATRSLASTPAAQSPVANAAARSRSVV